MIFGFGLEDEGESRVTGAALALSVADEDEAMLTESLAGEAAPLPPVFVAMEVNV